MTDLSGGKTSEDSFTILMANLVVEYAVDFQLGLFSCAAVGSTVKCISLGADRVGSLLPCCEGWLGKSPEMQLFAYRCILDHEGSGDWTLTKLRSQSEDLELIPWDVARRGFRSGFRWSRYRSWIHYAFDDALVYGGNLATHLVTPCCCWLGVDWCR
jgi:hypothetical protein